MLSWTRSRRHSGRFDGWSVAPTAAALAVALALGTAACSAAPERAERSDRDQTVTSDGMPSSGPRGEPAAPSPAPLTAKVNDAAEPVAVVDAQQPAVLSVAVSRELFATAPVVVVAQTGDVDSVREGADQATRLGVPLLLLDAATAAAPDTSTATAAPTDDASSTASPGEGASSTAAPAVDTAAQREEIVRLGAQSVLAMGPGTETALGELRDVDVDVVTDASELPALAPAPATAGLTVLLRNDAGRDAPAMTAAAASAEAVGAHVIPVATRDLRADPAVIAALAEQPPSRVLAVGPGFAPVDRLAGRLEVAATGTQLPGGGQVIFPGRRLVALYGHPGTPGLGVLGEQDLDASISRAKELAAQYAPLSPVPVVPAFEIIATVAQGSAGADGDYSGETAVEALRPWVERAGKEGVYVVLDLQPGRSHFLDQAKIYEDLLRMPHVGLALDPEWRLTPTQRPLGQIGRVEAEEVNAVIDWLADLTEQERLPQKLLVLHQFRLSMLQDTDQIELGRDQVQVLIHMDGQGAPNLKDDTWRSVVDAAPAGVPLGWKNFYDEDVPMLTPEETMTRAPTPLMISYQ